METWSLLKCSVTWKLENHLSCNVSGELGLGVRSASVVLCSSALSHPNEQTDVSCGHQSWCGLILVWSRDAFIWTSNLFCCLWTRARQNCCFFIELQRSMLESSHLLQAVLLRGTLYLWCFLSVLPADLRTFLPLGAACTAAESAESQSDADSCNSQIAV